MLGPAIVALAIWCAAGLITTASPDAASARYAILAPWWVLPVAFAGTWLVRPWRTRPLLALPALFATMPWWPIPLPTAALIWTGPAAWLPIGVAAACAIGARPLSVFGRAIHAGDCRRSAIAAGLATLVAGGLAAWSVAPHTPAGDEPHYLVITQSLLKDHDLRIENNHRQRDYAAYYDGELQPHYVIRGRNGEIYSIHSPGLPMFVLPAFAILGYRGAEIWLLLVAAVTGSLVWRIGWRATNSTQAAWLSWAAITLSSTFLLHSFAVFPDAPAACVMAAAILLLLHLQQTPERVGARALVVVGAMVAALPWLHTRFIVLAAGLVPLVVWQLERDGSRSPDARLKRSAIFLVLPVVSVIAWLAYFKTIYGTMNPAAPYGGAAGTRVAFIPGGLGGLLFDEQFGLLTYSPILAAAGLGLVGAGGRSIRRIGALTLALAGVYLACVATYWLWWAGSPANPARFAVAALPAFAIPLAAAWQGGDAVRRRLLLAAATLSGAITAALVVVNRGELAWNMRNAEAAWLNWLSPLADLARGWPSFFWTLDPDRLRSELAFGLHAVLWPAAFVTGWIVLERVSRRRGWSAEVSRVAIGLVLLGTIMAVVAAGWSLDGSNGLDAARSQMAVLNAGPPFIAIDRFQIRRVDTLDNRIQIRGEAPGRVDAPPPWLTLETVPAGRYELQIRSARPRAATLRVQVGDAERPVRVLPLRELGRQAGELWLPAGVALLTITPAGDAAGTDGRVQIEPLHAEATRRFARFAQPYGSANVYFLDDHAFPETAGFWIAGAASAELVIEPVAETNDEIAVTLRNGGDRNLIAIDAGGVKSTMTLGPSDSRVLTLRRPAGGGAINLTIASSAGFRPSDRGGSSDSRFLGVWVEIK